jgi:hypothetical protein
MKKEDEGAQNTRNRTGTSTTMPPVAYKPVGNSQICSFVDECDDLKTLRHNPLVIEFASMSEDTYKLVKATNPTLRMFVDAAREIVAGGSK